MVGIDATHLGMYNIKAIALTPYSIILFTDAGEHHWLLDELPYDLQDAIKEEGYL